MNEKKDFQILIVRLDPWQKCVQFNLNFKNSTICLYFILLELVTWRIQLPIPTVKNDLWKYLQNNVHCCRSNMMLLCKNNFTCYCLITRVMRDFIPKKNKGKFISIRKFWVFFKFWHWFKVYSKNISNFNIVYWIEALLIYYRVFYL